MLGPLLAWTGPYRCTVELSWDQGLTLDIFIFIFFKEGVSHEVLPPPVVSCFKSGCNRQRVIRTCSYTGQVCAVMLFLFILVVF